MNPFPCEVQTAHEQITVGARAEHAPELAREVVARQSRDRLQLRGMHDTGSLRVEKLSRALDDADVDV